MKILLSRSGRPQFLMLTLLAGFTSGNEGDFNCFYFSKCEHFLEVLWNEFDCVTVHAVNATSSWRKRQRMSLHLGGTAIHLGRMQMQAVKKINNSTQEKLTIQDFRSIWQTVEQALHKNL